MRRLHVLSVNTMGRHQPVKASVHPGSTSMGLASRVMARLALPVPKPFVAISPTMETVLALIVNTMERRQPVKANVQLVKSRSNETRLELVRLVPLVTRLIVALQSRAVSQLVAYNRIYLLR